MGSIAVTTGTVRVPICRAGHGTGRRDCPGVRSILKALDELAEGMDERRVESRKANRSPTRHSRYGDGARKYGPGVLEVQTRTTGAK